MNKIIKKEIVITEVLKNIIDIMIPANKDELMPKASNVIDIKKFVLKIFKNKKDKKIITDLIYDKIMNHKNIKKNDYKKIALMIFKSHMIENILEKELLKDYFTSNTVVKFLNLKTKKKLTNKKSDNQDIDLLVRVVKNSGARYQLP